MSGDSRTSCETIDHRTDQQVTIACVHLSKAQIVGFESTGLCRTVLKVTLWTPASIEPDTVVHARRASVALNEARTRQRLPPLPSKSPS